MPMPSFFDLFVVENCSFFAFNSLVLSLHLRNTSSLSFPFSLFLYWHSFSLPFPSPPFPILFFLFCHPSPHPHKLIGSRCSSFSSTLTYRLTHDPFFSYAATFYHLSFLFPLCSLASTIYTSHSSSLSLFPF